MLEICVEDHAGLAAAIDGGADRIELCSALAIGGITPSGGLIAAALTAPVPVHILLRPRGGDFVHDAAEEAILAEDLDRVAQAGVAGIAIGATKADGTLDAPLLARLIARARAWEDRRDRPLSITLHRAFDLCPDLPDALDTAISLGFDRILTSGGAANAIAGRAMLTSLVQQANGRIGLVAGSGIGPDTASAILATGVPELHASCGASKVLTDRRLVSLGFAPARMQHTDRNRVAALAKIMRAHLEKKSLSKTNS